MFAESHESEWVKFRDKVTSSARTKAVKRFREKGIQVFVKTDLGKEKLVYDSAVISDNKQSLVKFGVKIKDRNGNIITEYGQYPPTSSAKQAIILGTALIGGWTIFKGIKNFY